MIKASMGAGNLKKQGWEWKREELTVKDQRTNYKLTCFMLFAFSFFPFVLLSDAF